MLHHTVKLVAMRHQKTTTVGGLVNGVTRHQYTAEMHPAEVAHHLVMIARHIDDLHAAPRQAQDLLDHIIMGLRPVPNMNRVLNFKTSNSLTKASPVPIIWSWR